MVCGICGMMLIHDLRMMVIQTKPRGGVDHCGAKWVEGAALNVVYAIFFTFWKANSSIDVGF